MCRSLGYALDTLIAYKLVVPAQGNAEAFRTSLTIEFHQELSKMQEKEKQWLGRDGEEKHTTTRARGQIKVRNIHHLLHHTYASKASIGGRFMPVVRLTRLA
jgi:hypothetical protein